MATHLESHLGVSRPSNRQPVWWKGHWCS